MNNIYQDIVLTGAFHKILHIYVILRVVLLYWFKRKSLVISISFKQNYLSRQQQSEIAVDHCFASFYRQYNYKLSLLLSVIILKLILFNNKRSRGRP